MMLIYLVPESLNFQQKLRQMEVAQDLSNEVDNELELLTNVL